MERYLLFIYDLYYPLGGWEDFYGSFATVESARKLAVYIMTSRQQCNIADGETGMLIEVWHDRTELRLATEN